MMIRGRRAFTLIEMLITATIVSVMAGLAIDMFGGSRFERVDAGVRLLEADLGYARSVALSTPADPVCSVSLPMGAVTTWHTPVRRIRL
jgi:prepilin-type N-terminal cleavage/methylation domain-containing protein